MRLRTLNFVLLGVIIFVNSYILLTPLLPKLLFAVQNAEIVSKLENEITTPPVPTGSNTPAELPILIVPSMKLRETIHEVPTTHSIRNDLWRRPNTSTPDKGSNTVIVGHRFTYTNPTGVLYHLDKMQVGDTLALTWGGKRYVYRASNIQVVLPSATYIENATDEPQLTLYSCTPLWNPKERLVVTATLEAIL